jgi:hypothetical protein
MAQTHYFINEGVFAAIKLSDKASFVRKVSKTTT